MQFIDINLENYCIAHSNPSPDYLTALERETHQKTLAPQMLSGPLMGRFLSFLSTLKKPNCIVEIGTFTGYSALCLAEGLSEDGLLHTFEINDELQPIIEKYFDQSPYSKQLRLHLGPAEKLLPEMEIEIDLAFLDAGKTLYSGHFELLFKKLKPGGLILVDNVLWSGKVLAETSDPETTALRAFNDRLIQDPRCSQIMLPIRDGITLIQKIA